MFLKKQSSLLVHSEKSRKILTCLHFQRLGLQFLDHLGTWFFKPKAMRKGEDCDKLKVLKSMLAQTVTFLWPFILVRATDVLASSGMSRYYLALYRYILSAHCYTMGTEYFSNHVTSRWEAYPSVNELLWTDTQPPSFLLSNPAHLNHWKNV